MVSYQPIIGLEIHIELKTRSKMFCSCSADCFGHKPNTHVCPVCLGLPGSLPVANKKAIEWTILAGLALNCEIPLFSKFDRKNYFYPDLPKGYQISQYDLPLCKDGFLNFPNLEAAAVSVGKKARIRRVHLEEDTAKMIHTKKATLLDFNRSGVPLMEVVTEPDIRNLQEAKEFLKKLQQIIRYLGISDCDMEKGSMRIEPNVSVGQLRVASKDTSDGGRVERSETSDSSEVDEKLPNYKVEIKNINSFRFMEKALIYEIERQTKLLKQGREPTQETRGWDEVKQVTVLQRIKEEAQDYRYFPEPDLPPMRLRYKDIKILREKLPELPDKKMARFKKQYGLTTYQVRILIDTREKADYFEKAVKIGKKHRLSAKEITNVIINKRVNIEKILPTELVKILKKKKAIPKVSEVELKKIVTQVLKDNPKAMEDYRKGKTAVIEFLVGQVVKKTKGKADPNQTRKEIVRLLNSK